MQFRDISLKYSNLQRPIGQSSRSFSSKYCPFTARNEVKFKLIFEYT